MQRLARRIGSTLMTPLRAYDAAAKKNPATVGIITTVLKTSAADLFAQKIVEKKEEIDWKRNAVFGAFGFAYLGIWQYHLYANLFHRWTPAIQSVVGARGVTFALTFIDQAIHHPIMYFPCFYLLRGSIAGEAPMDSLMQYKEHMWENLKALWAVWVPSQLINFSVVPLHLRVPFVAFVSFTWCVILSLMRGDLEPSKVQLAESVTAYADDGSRDRAATGATSADATSAAVDFEGAPDASDSTVKPAAAVAAVGTAKQE